MSWYRTAFGAHYRLLYRHRDEAEARRCLAALRELAPLGAGPVLDLGCGDGRHLPPLAALGVRAVGLDLSAPLLAAAARRRGADVRFDLVRGDMRRPPLAAVSFSAILSLFTAFGYFGGLEEHRGLVGRIAALLRPGGRWFLDYLDCEAVRRELASGPATRERREGPLRLRETRRLAAAPERVVKAVRVVAEAGREDEAAALGVPADGLAYCEEVALFTVAAMDALAAAAGLRRVAAAGGYDGRPLREGRSDRWLLVYRRPGAGRREVGA